MFPHKTAYFLDNSHDTLKNADDSKFHVTKLNPWKLNFQNQPMIAGDEIKVNVILANKYKVKAWISSSRSLTFLSTVYSFTDMPTLSG